MACLIKGYRDAILNDRDVVNSTCEYQFYRERKWICL